MALWQLVTFPLLIFVSYKEPPFKSLDKLSPIKWIDIMPFIFAIIAIFDFALLPIMSVVHTVMNYKSVQDSNFTGMLTFVAFINAVFLFYWTPFFAKILQEPKQIVEVKKKQKVSVDFQNWDEIRKNTDHAISIK